MSLTRRLLVAELLVGVIANSLGCDWSLLSRKSPFLSKSAAFALPGCSYEAIWRKAPDSVEVVHVVFLPNGVPNNMFGSIGLGHKPLPMGITSVPDGLYTDGVRVPRGDGRRVFVYTWDRKLRPVPLTENELKAITPNAMEMLETAEAWKKIKTIIDEEQGNWFRNRAREKLSLMPVEAPKPDEGEVP